MRPGRFRLPPVALALAIQFTVYLGLRQLSPLLGLYPSPWTFALACGVLAALVGHLAGLARWWLAIQLLFVPALLGALRLDLPPIAYLAAFLLLLTVYWSAFRSQVPLYLSSRKAGDALLARLPDKPGCRFIDLGSGTGGLVLRLARARPDAVFHGVESAPLPALAGWLRARWQPNCHLGRGDFWAEDLGNYDVVYAYLSPVPMPRLWAKVAREMRPGSLFVSNSFEVPGIEPDEVFAIDDLHRARLLVWRR